MMKETTLDRRAVLFALSAALAAGPSRAAGTQPSLIPAPDRELRIPVSGGDLYVRINGDIHAGSAPLILVHGGPGGALWQMLPAVPLSSTRPVILYDQLDSGRSSSPGDPANWTVDRFASEITSIRQTLGLERVHLLGHSWGGQVATRYAAGRPDGLLSLTLQGTPPSAARAEASVAGLLAALPGDAGSIISRAEETGAFDDPAYQRALFGFYRQHIGRTDVTALGMAYMDGLPEDRGLALATALNGATQTRFTGTLRGFDDEPLLSAISAPTLLMCGEFDVMTPDATRAVLPLLRTGSFTEIADAGHMIQFDQPQAWRSAISEFLAHHDG